ncbi:hypothetical protein IB229_19965 [Pseudomonas sp. PDM14]|uniref:hypothetical protein n=1 Tax=Pseudomonas sp. PDM14 TaxID=2769288 RepID=UPI00177E8CC0|nr:hypothetical protein [Pseudomonas sp. PDM14]MBD9485262.1 hypothetical protein [Pseudomonas sp. PDM14]
MLRIKGTIGAWPVDLTLELDAQDWAQLAAHLPVAQAEAEVAPAPRSPAAPAVNPAQDALWQAAQALLQQEKEMEGPQLLAALAGLAGGDAAGKRLLVRLRHCPQVQLENGAQAPLYRWVG